ncbi:hypothetical protein BJX70DRAFT_353992 [Aspergillus crustosus]
MTGAWSVLLGQWAAFQDFRPFTLSFLNQGAYRKCSSWIPASRMQALFFASQQLKCIWNTEAEFEVFDRCHGQLTGRAAWVPCRQVPNVAANGAGTQAMELQNRNSMTGLVVQKLKSKSKDEAFFVLRICSWCMDYWQWRPVDPGIGCYSIWRFLTFATYP